MPGHIHLRELVQAAKLGVAAGGGTPVEFPVIGICDGIAMNHDGMKYPLATRELIVYLARYAYLVTSASSGTVMKVPGEK